MKIALNALCADNRSGTGYYARGLAGGFAQLAADTGAESAAHTVLVILPESLRGRHPTGGNMEFEYARTAGTLSRIWWEERQLPRLLRERHVDLLHGPAFVIPSRCPCPAVVTVHDCAFLRFPETIAFLKRHYYRRRITASAKSARLVLTDSEFAAAEIRARLGIDASRIHAVPLGVDARFRRDVAPDEIQAVRNRYILPQRFILFVGVIEPRKNLATLLRAYAAAREKGLESDLVLAGRSGWMNREIYALPGELNIREHVRFPGFVGDEDLPALYAAADLFAYPSLYEGFGLPVLEAMAAGLPVLVSDAPALVEVLGEAGMIIPATDVEAWTDALLVMSREDDRRRDLAAAARRRAAPFTWQQTARRTLAAYEAALQALQ